MLRMMEACPDAEGCTHQACPHKGEHQRLAACLKPHCHRPDGSKWEKHKKAPCKEKQP